MKLIETDSGLPRLAGERSGGTSSPARRGEGASETLVASRTLAVRVRVLRGSVWAPVVAKGAALLAGMLALAAVGASSLARGSGVPLPASATPAHAHLKTAALVAPAAAAQAGELDVSSADAGAEPPAPPTSSAVTTDGKVILNLAQESDLRHLPGIGAKRAEAILALRAKLGGRFKRVAELLRVKGIGPKGLRKLEPRVVLDAPKQP